MMGGKFYYEVVCLHVEGTVRAGFSTMAAGASLMQTNERFLLLSHHDSLFLHYLCVSVPHSYTQSFDFTIRICRYQHGKIAQRMQRFAETSVAVLIRKLQKN